MKNLQKKIKFSCIEIETFEVKNYSLLFEYGYGFLLLLSFKKVFEILSQHEKSSELLDSFQSTVM